MIEARKNVLRTSRAMSIDAIDVAAGLKKHLW